MKELQRRQRIKKVIYSLPSLIVLLVVAVLLVKGAFGVISKERESAKYVRELREEATALSLRGAGLESDIARLNTEEGVIEEIKEKFGVALPGEHVAILVDEKVRAVEPQELKDEWFKKWWSSVSHLWQR